MAYGQLTTPFVPTGAGSTLETTFLYTPTGAAQTLLSGSASAFDLSVDASDVLSFNLLSGVEIDGVAATSGVTVLAEGYHTITGELLNITPVPYRYYRIYIHNNNNNNNDHSGFQEIELATTPGGADITSPGMPTTTNSQFSGTRGPDKTIINSFIDFNDSWVTVFGEAADAWMTVDLGSPQALSELRMWPEFDNTWGPLRSPKDFDVEGSNDGTNWTLIRSFYNVNDWIVGDEKVFDLEPIADIDILAASNIVSVIGPYQYFRISISENNGHTFTILQEIEISTTPGGADITSPGMPTDADTFVNGFAPSGAIDNVFTGSGGDVSWATGSGFPVPTWWSVDTQGSHIPNELRIWPETPGSAPKNFDFEGSNDGSNWTVIKSFNGYIGWVQGVERVFSVATKNFQTQLHTCLITDPLDGNNSVLIDNAINAQVMPLDTDITNAAGDTIYGTWEDMHPTQPWVPKLIGGEDDGTYTPDKYEAYNGDNTTGNFVLGVDTTGAQITSDQTDGKIGSWTTGNVGDILVAKTGAVIKVTAVAPNVLTYSALLGTTQEIQDGFYYPNTFRVLNDVGGIDNSDEHYYFDNGGLYPWPG